MTPHTQETKPDIDSISPPTVTQIAQIKREKVLIITQAGENNKQHFSGKELRQAYAMADDLTKAMQENQMGLIIVPEEEEGDIFSVQPFHYLADEINLFQVIGDPDSQTKLLAGWYKNLYEIIQSGEKSSYFDEFRKTLAPLGINIENQTTEEHHMLMGYHQDTDIIRRLTHLQNFALEILEISLPSKEGNQTLTQKQTLQYTFQIWKLIGEISPFTKHCLENFSKLAQTTSPEALDWY